MKLDYKKLPVDGSASQAVLIYGRRLALVLLIAVGNFVGLAILSWITEPIVGVKVAIIGLLLLLGLLLFSVFVASLAYSTEIFSRNWEDIRPSQGFSRIWRITQLVWYIVSAAIRLTLYNVYLTIVALVRFPRIIEKALVRILKLIHSSVLTLIDYERESK